MVASMASPPSYDAMATDSADEDDEDDDDVEDEDDGGGGGAIIGALNFRSGMDDDDRLACIP